MAEVARQSSATFAEQFASPGTSMQFADDCWRERGRVLTGAKRHYCMDWDGLTMDETCDEIETCHCFDADPPPPRVLCADPPWQFGDKIGKRGADANYSTLTVDEICAFPRPAMNEGYLFLWRVSSMVEDAYRVCRAWGFVPKSEIVWQKLTKQGKPWFGMGRHVRASHETAIVAVRGKVKPLSRSERSTLSAPVPVGTDGKYIHSAKPEEFYDKIERLAEGPYVELFARRYRPGWQCFGNELPSPVDRLSDAWIADLAAA